MPYKERLTVLHEAEINDLYGVPSLSLEEKRISFTLNDLEQDVIKSIRDRNHKCYAIALLGYFKIKPIQLNPAYAVVIRKTALGFCQFPELSMHCFNRVSRINNSTNVPGVSFTPRFCKSLSMPNQKSAPSLSDRYNPNTSFLPSIFGPRTV